MSTPPLLAEAAAWLRAGKPAEAIAPLRQAAELRPADAGIQHDYGLACLACGQVADAVAALQRAVALDPHFANAHLRLGIALEAAGRLEDALAVYRRAAHIAPSLADAHYRTGALLDSLGRTTPAAEAYGMAAGAAPKTTLGRIAAARARLAENRDGEAENILRRAVALDPGSAVALDLLGNLLADSGRFAEAGATLTRAIEISPLLAGSYYDIVRCRRMDDTDSALIARIGAALDTPGLDPIQRSRVHLALGKAADDLGQYEGAMRHFDAAEALRNSVVNFDLDAFEALIDRIISIFTTAFFQNVVAPARPGALPILILGLPRSGTTLVEQIASAHPRVHAGGELPFWNERGHLWEAAGADDAAFTAAAAADYLALLRTIAPRGARVTDKMPLNLLWAGLIHAALPDAIILHCRRSPIDTALSIHQTHFNPRMAFPTGGPALVATIRAFQRLAAHWRRVLPPARFIDVDYEALVAAPEPTIRGIVAVCGLPWHDACLRPERNARVVKTPSKFQARQPITAGSVERWRRYEPWLGSLAVLVPAAVGTEAVLF